MKEITSTIASLTRQWVEFKDKCAKLEAEVADQKKLLQTYQDVLTHKVPLDVTHLLCNACGQPLNDDIFILDSCGAVSIISHLSLVPLHT